MHGDCSKHARTDTHSHMHGNVLQLYVLLQACVMASRTLRHPFDTQKKARSPRNSFSQSIFRASATRRRMDDEWLPCLFRINWIIYKLHDVQTHTQRPHIAPANGAHIAAKLNFDGQMSNSKDTTKSEMRETLPTYTNAYNTQTNSHWIEMWCH